ncbi:MAG: ABC transporter permease [Coprobacillus sp.]
MNKFWTLFKQDLFNLISSPGTLGVFLIFPTALISLMGFLFEDLYNTPLVSSYDFYGVTMIFFIAMMGATVPANCFLEKRIKSGNTRIFYSPVSRVTIYSSKIIACFLFIGTCLSLNVIIYQSLSFVNFGDENMIYVILLLLNFILFLTLLSSAICVTLHNEQLTNVILSNSMSVIGFLSGIMFPIASLGPVFEKMASFSPMKWTIDSVFQLIYDGASANYLAIMLGLLGLSLLLLLVVHKNYRPKDYI